MFVHKECAREKDEDKNQFVAHHDGPNECGWRVKRTENKFLTFTIGIPKISKTVKVGAINQKICLQIAIRLRD